jgi:AcrR family transcriptional regulator
MRQNTAFDASRTVLVSRNGHATTAQGNVLAAFFLDRSSIAYSADGTSASMAGIASAAVHWYFPTKDDLFAAVLERVFGEAIAEAEAPGRAPRDRLEAFLSKTQKYRVLHREAYERMEESEALRAVYSGLLQWLEDSLLQAISIRLPEGADTDLIADTAHVLLEGMLISARKLDRPVGEMIDMVIDALVATAVAKLAARSGSASRP